MSDPAIVETYSTFMGIMGADIRRTSGMPVCAKDGIHLWAVKPGRMARCVECHKWRMMPREAWLFRAKVGEWWVEVSDG